VTKGFLISKISGLNFKDNVYYRRVKTTSIGSLSDNHSDHESLFSLALSRKSQPRKMSSYLSVMSGIQKDTEKQQEQKEFLV